MQSLKFENETPKIYSSTIYKDFQLIIENRKISLQHVMSLVNDPTFPANSCSCPIVVMPFYKGKTGYFVVEGQHRLKACEMLKIPVYYIINPHATVDYVRVSNKNTRRWVGDDFSHYYSFENKSYSIIRDILSKIPCKQAFVNAVIMRLAGMERHEYGVKLKNGLLNIEKYEKQINDFISLFYSQMILIRENGPKGQEKMRALMMSYYVKAFVDLYLQDKEKMKKVLKNIRLMSGVVPFQPNVDCSKKQIEVYLKWTPGKEIDTDALESGIIPDKKKRKKTE